MAVNTGIGPVLACLIHPIHHNPSPPAQVGGIPHGVVLKLLKRLDGVPNGKEFGNLELVWVTESPIFVWVCWERSLLKVLLGKAMVSGKNGDVIHPAGDQVGLIVAVWVDPDVLILVAVLVAAVAAGLWVIWSSWSLMQNRFTNLRVLSVPWHWCSQSGWLLWERNVVRTRGEDGSGIGKCIEVVKQSINSEVGDDWAAPCTFIR